MSLVVVSFLAPSCRVAGPESHQESRKRPLSALLRQLEDDGIGVRESGKREVLERWREWNDSDRKLLEDAGRSSRIELATTTKNILRRVMARKGLGREVLALPSLNKSILEGGPEVCAALLGEAGDQWKNSKLSDSDLKSIVALAIAENWDLLPSDLLELVAEDRIRPYAGLLARLVKSDSVELKTAALTALGSVGAMDFSKDILGLLGDLDHRVRAHAFSALGTLGAIECAPELLPYVDHVDFEMRFMAIQALGLMGADEAAEKLGAIVNRRNEEPEVRRMAIWALGLIGGSKSFPCIRASLSHPDQRIRAEAVGALSQYERSECLGDLKLLVSDSDPSVRGQTALMMAIMDGQAAREQLGVLLNDRDPWVVARAAEAIGYMEARFNSKEDLKALCEQLEGLCDSSETDVRLSAAITRVRWTHRDIRYQESLVGEVSKSDDLMSRYGPPLVRALNAAWNEEVFGMLAKAGALAKPVESLDDIRDAVRRLGLTIEFRPQHSIRGRMTAGRNASLLTVLERHVAWQNTILLEGRCVRLTTINDALEYWDSKLRATRK